MSLFPYIDAPEKASIDVLARKQAQDPPSAKRLVASRAGDFTLGLGVINALAASAGYVVGGEQGALEAVTQINYAGVPVLAGAHAEALRNELKKQPFVTRYEQHKKRLSLQVKQARSALYSFVDAGFTSSLTAGAFFVAGTVMNYALETPLDGEMVLFTGALSGLAHSMRSQKQAMRAEQEVVACAKEIYSSGKGTPNPRDSRL